MLNYVNEDLESIFEATIDRIEIFKILMLIAPIAIARNDGKYHQSMHFL